MWWYWRGIINFHFLKGSVILNIQLYSQYLERFHKSLIVKRSSVGKSCSLLWQWKNSCSIINTGNNFKIRLNYQQYLLGPAIFVHWITLWLKKEENEDEIQKFVEYFFKSKSAKSYSKVTEDLVTIAYNGEYIIE